MDGEIVLLILGMGAVTYLPRMLPLVGLSKVELPEILLAWLKYIPAAVLAALLAPAIFAPEGSLLLSFDNQYLLAALPTFLVGVKTRSLVATVSVGMLAMVILQQLV
jgi:branched-subunit amino acid transport protein